MVTAATTPEENGAVFPTTRAGRRTLHDEVRPGLCFREVMKGMITKGSTDPVEGYKNEAAVGMSLRASVSVSNLPAFLEDPNHRGSWAAGGSIPVWGGAITSDGSGDFRLFRRTIGPERKPLREMVYDTLITVGGQTYVMRGRKVIQPGPPWRVWPAATTLHVRLLELGNTSGPVVAAGILRLSPTAFLRQLTTMRITGRFGVVDKISYLGQFFRFFAGSLVRTYIYGRRW